MAGTLDRVYWTYALATASGLVRGTVPSPMPPSQCGHKSCGTNMVRL